MKHMAIKTPTAINTKELCNNKKFTDTHTVTINWEGSHKYLSIISDLTNITGLALKALQTGGIKASKI